MKVAIDFIVNHKGELALILFTISELLPLTEKVKANGIFQFFYLQVKKLAGK
jgi:hypothetical protein